MINSSSKKSVSAKSSLYIFGILILIILLCIPIFIKSANWLQIMILILWYAGLTLSWNFVGGFAGVLPLGHAAYAGVGAYVSTLLFINSGLSPWIGMIIGGIVSALIALIIGIPTFKLHGAYYALASIAFVESIRMVVENTNEIFGIKVNGARGLLIPLEGHAPILFQFGGKVYYYYVILFFVLLILFISYKIQKSKLGFYLVAGGEDQEAAESLGVNVTYQKLIALAISAFFMGILGTFYAQLILYIYPLGIISMVLSFEIAFIAIIGGRGTLFGPILGSFILVPLAEISRMYLSGSRFLGIHLMLYSSIIILVMLYMPGGLISIFERLFYPRGIDKLR
jgi:branched-chain amino acid transport system permease protein